MISRNFLPGITLPTCVTPISSTLIDSIFCDRVDAIEATNVIMSNISGSFQIFSRERTPSLTDDVITLKYKISSDECLLKFNYSILQLNWLSISNNDDGNESY